MLQERWQNTVYLTIVTIKEPAPKVFFAQDLAKSKTPETANQTTFPHWKYA